jgi:hypothetical protein
MSQFVQIKDEFHRVETISFVCEIRKIMPSETSNEVQFSFYVKFTSGSTKKYAVSEDDFETFKEGLLANYKSDKKKLKKKIYQEVKDQLMQEMYALGGLLEQELAKAFSQKSS